MDHKEQTDVKRRDFLKIGAAAAGIGAAMVGIGGLGCEKKRGVGEARTLFKTSPLETVRVGYVGVGSQGTSHVRNLLKVEGAEIVAVCDMVEDRARNIQKMAKEAGKKEPEIYIKGAEDYKRMCQREDLDLVYTATPWNLHVPVCVEAMNNGKHAATEVPAAVTLDECWQLVETAEKTNLHCIMMENCCYDRFEMMIFNMIQKGLLGELLHATCGYLHDLRHHKLSKTGYWNMWRLAHSIKRNGDVYPTHGLGPVMQAMDINRGNQFDYLTAMASNSRGLNLYAAELHGPESTFAKQKYALGDIVTTMIKTVNGQTIRITHDTNSPRPYSRDLEYQGTKGIARKYPEQKIHIEGKSPKHAWEDLEQYVEEYDHPVWKAMEEKSKGAGHGGMDFIEDYRLIQALRKGEPLDMDVYDAAACCAVSELSERSIASQGQPVKVPDFTRGKWKTNPPLGILKA